MAPPDSAHAHNPPQDPSQSLPAGAFNTITNSPPPPEASGASSRNPSSIPTSLSHLLSTRAFHSRPSDADPELKLPAATARAALDSHSTVNPHGRRSPSARQRSCAFRMRIPIREQLGLLVLLVSLISIAVIAIATWLNNYSFVLDIRSSRLSLAASLKAAQVSSALTLLSTSVQAITTRVILQNALQRYNAVANNTDANWVRAQSDLVSAFGGANSQVNVLQLVVYGRDNTGPGGTTPLLNATAALDTPIPLPWYYANGTQAMLGDDEGGFPPSLYPNITAVGPAFNNATYSPPPNDTANTPPFSPPYPFNTSTNAPSSGFILGPLPLNDSFALFSISVPIINNTSKTDVLGYLTAVVNANLIIEALHSREGLDQTGEALLVGPDTQFNKFPNGFLFRGLGSRIANSTEETQDALIRFVIPPENNATQKTRHNSFSFGQPQRSFPLKDYPAILMAYQVQQRDLNNAGSEISTTNEQKQKVSVGFALPATPFADWALVVEETKAEAFAPIVRLRNLLLACVFGTVGFILLITFPIAHYSVLPIRRLKDATKESTESYEEDDDSDMAVVANDIESGNEKHSSLAFWRKKKPKVQPDDRRRVFRIPSKVSDKKHFVHDELTELTTTYNLMTDELLKQYETLEERVKERTAQLELSKKAAEAANESKTMFIASISHELKTPLNGILGMCTVCMTENDVHKIRQSLKIVSESGELLLSLLNDLLTFTKHQIGHQITLEEREFRISLISTQILSIFDKQARDAGIQLSVEFEGGVPDPNAAGLSQDALPFGPPLAGKVENFNVWGDRNRVLQVIINLVGNSLKFTPRGGSVTIRIKCLEEITSNSEDDISRRGSNRSRASRFGSRHTSAPASVISPSLHSDRHRKMDTALTINAMDNKHQPIVIMSEKSVPPPIAAKTFMFEFEVEDTGPGIPPELQDQIFEPFVQGDVGLSKKFGGTGLGLSICSQLSRLMGGSISLHSEVGVGSNFAMRLPLKLLKEQAESTIDSRRGSIADDGTMLRSDSVSNGSVKSGHSNGNSNNNVVGAGTRLVGLSLPYFATETTKAPGESPLVPLESRDNRIRILVADDNAINQEVVLRMLKLEDIYDITLAKDGQEALEKVKESMEQNRRFDLIFMDIQMPNLDGLQSTRQIRDLGYSAPIVALTAFAEESNVKECMDSGMNYFLSKPIRRPALKHVLKTYCAPIPEEGETPNEEGQRSNTT